MESIAAIDDGVRKVAKACRMSAYAMQRLVARTEAILHRHGSPLPNNWPEMLYTAATVSKRNVWQTDCLFQLKCTEACMKRILIAPTSLLFP